VLRLLPGWYRDKWEEDMVAAFLDSWLTGDRHEDECILEFCRPTWPEVANFAWIVIFVALVLGRYRTARVLAALAIVPGLVAWRTRDMLCQRPRLPSALASVLATAGIVLAVASCTGHITPLGPDQAATLPQPHHLRSPLILQDMRTQGLVSPSGGCPAGWVTLSGGQPGQCFRKTGTPVTITSAAVSPVFPFRPPPPPGQQAPPVQYGFSITVPAADVPALAVVLPTAPGHSGPPTASVVTSAIPIPTISVAGRTWVLRGYGTRFAGREFDVTLSSRNQALQLQRMLAASG
jgi:hypothetical protein